jgi:hypothetical protein
MQDRFRQALERALALDPEIHADPHRLRAILLDLCPGGTRGQILVLVKAAEEGIVTSLLRSHGAGKAALREIHRLARIFHRGAAVDWAHAEWALRVWSAALGLSAGPEIQILAPSPPAEPPIPSVEISTVPPVLPRALPAGGKPVKTSPELLPTLASLSPTRVFSGSSIGKRRRALPFLGLAAAVCLGVFVFAWQFFPLQVSEREAVESRLETVMEAEARVPPPGFWRESENLARLAGTFVGTLNTQDGGKETLVLTIRDIQTASGQGAFLYTLNSAGARTDNMGRLSLAQAKW